MGKVVHFEIHVDDMERAKAFYGEVFGWTYEDWSGYAGMPYWGAITGDPGAMGINGALMQRKGPSPQQGQPLNGYACTLGVGDYDATEAKILAHGGKLALAKYALPGMAWQGYYIDTEGNTFGIHQPDLKAK
ncbi:VOC family protein [Paenibacillus sacheonensis]|uniref:VOC family protein n=1 Tax=Paenibacillus sacheonensis TaxID=742054 RepID=A0A7X4YR81_9BACL|nr:VOC family protein [Paenibacillus sacheonensis]MBM7567064.1 putative enzyme related to lactoylglutathione lyase [Paenibacillus sacheonensis]NBC71005.1 VOC family protein [Paenibacillus sacheonensis]